MCSVVERSHQLQSQCDKLQSTVHLLEEQLGWCSVVDQEFILIVVSKGINWGSKYVSQIA